MQTQHGAVELRIGRAAVGVHHKQLPSQVVPPLAPADISFQPVHAGKSTKSIWQGADV